MRSKILGFLAVLFLAGCADMINSLREESAAIDREVDKDRVRSEEEETPALAIKGSNENRGFGRRLSSVDGGTNRASSAGWADSPGPATAVNPSPSYKRVTRSDFVDTKASENSLWDGQGQANYLFSHNRQRQLGDLITADVEKEMKREIQYQLWMTLPPEQRKPKRAPASVGDPSKPGESATPEKTAQKSGIEQGKDAAEEAAKTNMAAGDKDDDIVRMEIAEDLGNGLIRVVGQKRVIYRGVARVVEVVGLVNNKDIDDTNRVKSSAFLDMKTQVIQ